MSYVDPRSFVGVEQILAILEYIKENPQLAHGRFCRTKEGRSLVQQHWAACADLANNVSSECIQKSPDQWRAYYSAYKSKLKKKIREIKAEIIATGEAPARKKLTELENKMLLILGPDLGERYPRVSKTPRLEVEHQPSSSTAEFLTQEDSNVTDGSNSSEVELYYPEDGAENLSVADTLKHGDQQLNPMVYTTQELEPLVHKSQKFQPVDYAKPQRESVYRSQQMDHVHTNPELESVGRTDQGQSRSVDNTVHHIRPAALTDQRTRPDFHIKREMEPTAHANQEPVTGGSSQKMKSENAAPQRSQRETKPGHVNDPVPMSEASEVLLTIERMKVETKREANAAVNRLAGALEAIAEKLGGLHKLRSTSPRRAKRRYARIYSSDSN